MVSLWCLCCVERALWRAGDIADATRGAGLTSHPTVEDVFEICPPPCRNRHQSPGSESNLQSEVYYRKRCQRRAAEATIQDVGSILSWWSQRWGWEKLFIILPLVRDVGADEVCVNGTVQKGLNPSRAPWILWFRGSVFCGGPKQGQTVAKSPSTSASQSPFVEFASHK